MRMPFDVELWSDMPDDYLAVNKWVIPPEIRIENDYLCYAGFPKDRSKWQWTERPNARLLYDFAQLVDADAQTILNFARQWGVLNPPSLGPDIYLGLDLLRNRPIVTRESLGAWHGLSRRFGEMLADIKAARRQQPDRAEKAAREITYMAHKYGGLCLILAPTGTGAATLKLGSSTLHGLLAALCYQLMVLMTGSKGLYACAECGRLFKSQKTRCLNQDTYCPRCGKAAAWRAASRRYYQQRVKKPLVHPKTMSQ